VQEATGESVELAYADRGCTSSPSPAIPSTGPSPRSCQVRNTL
jgi:hypothetical protein